MSSYTLFYAFLKWGLKYRGTLQLKYEALVHTQDGKAMMMRMRNSTRQLTLTHRCFMHMKKTQIYLLPLERCTNFLS